MTNAQKIELRLSAVKQRLNEISGLDGDDFTDEVRSEASALEKEYPDLETRHRAAILADGTTTETRSVETGDAQDRERLELRGKASVGRYLLGAARGKVEGAERELADAAGVPDGAIPLELWATERRDDQLQLETRDISPAPSTTGINLDVLRPAVFAPSIVDKLGVEMPMVESGTYATGTISTLATADAVAKGDDVPETAAAFTVTTTTPKRVGASLNLAAEDIAAVGQQNFEAVLRQHISLVLSSELDRQMLNGDGTSDDLTGIFQRLTDPTAAPSAIATFDALVGAFADAVDGLWATMTSEVSIVVGPATYQLASKIFRDGTDDRGAISFADYARSQYGGFWTNSRMPAAATFLTVDNVQQALLYRRGMMMMPTPMRTAVCPSWGYLTVDDIYTGARKAERRYVISALVGDVILVQPDAYQQIAFRVS